MRGTPLVDAAPNLPSIGTPTAMTSPESRGRHQRRRRMLDGLADDAAPRRVNQSLCLGRRNSAFTMFHSPNEI